MYRKEAFMTLDSLLARGRTRSTHVTEGYVCGSARGVLACGEDAKEEESVSASARVRERRENIQRERGVGADARAAVPSDKCLDCQSGATSRPPRREDHACRGSDSSSNSLVVTWKLTTSGGVRTTPPGGSRARITFGILPGYNQPDLSAIRSRTGVFGVESRHDAILEMGVAPRGVGGGLGQIGRGGSRSGRARVREGPGGDAPA